MAEPMPSARYEQVRVRDQFRCVRCSVHTLEGAWHHRRSRSRRDSHTHCSCVGVWLCHDCHRWVHAHPFEARAAGWIVSRFVDEPWLIPYLRVGDDQWIFPNCRGGFAASITATDQDEARELFTARGITTSSDGGGPLLP